MKKEFRLFGEDIERYFDSDADMIKKIENGSIYTLQVIIDTDEQTAIWYTQTESKSCNSIGQSDDYAGALAKLSEIGVWNG